ncbi:MAG TPA: iron-containing alcohol dehydrogenase, partial [Gemmatimonadaceae bacterium]
MNFEFATAARIIFGPGKLRDVGALAASLGTRALVVHGSSARTGPLVDLLQAHGVTTTSLRVAGEPTTTLVERGAEHARRERCDLVIALGGGSVIDAGKAVAALIANREPLVEYLEVVGRARPLTERSVPMIA